MYSFAPKSVGTL